MRALRSRRSTLIVAVSLSSALALAGCGDGDGNGNGTGNGDAEPGASSVTVAGTDGLAFEPTSLSAAAGQDVSVTLECGEAVEHDFVIEGHNGDAVIAHCDPGGSETGTFNVPAGDHTFYCSIPGHRQAGMEGTLTAS